MERVPVQSEGVEWVAYDSEAQTLDVHFGPLRTYRYFEVPHSVYDWLLRARSKGRIDASSGSVISTPNRRGVFR